MPIINQWKQSFTESLHFPPYLPNGFYLSNVLITTLFKSKTIWEASVLSLKTWRKLTCYSADLLVNTVTFTVNLPYSWSFEHTIEWTLNWSKFYRWWEEHHVIMAGFILETFDERPTTKISATSAGWVFLSYNWKEVPNYLCKTSHWEDRVVTGCMANDIGF